MSSIIIIGIGTGGEQTAVGVALGVKGIRCDGGVPTSTRILVDDAVELGLPVSAVTSSQQPSASEGTVVSGLSRRVKTASNFTILC